MYHLIEEGNENARRVGPATVGQKNIWNSTAQGDAPDKAGCAGSDADGTRRLGLVAPTHAELERRERFVSLA